MSGGTGKSKADLEWERRVLCSDEACIGTIGPDGNCRECGRPYEGDLKQWSGQDTDDEELPAADDGDEATIDHEPDEDDEDGDENGADGTHIVDEWEQRTLCSDDNCIGVIGPDGRCKECGKPYEA